MSALTPTEELLLEFARRTLPHWFIDEPRAQEYLFAAAELMADARDVIQFWFGQSLILNAIGATATEPDWLNQHALDRGTHRQDGEIDAALRDRLRSIPEALTKISLLAASQSILDAAGIIGTAAIVELRGERAYFTDLISDQGSNGGAGGTFIGPDASDVMDFEPDKAFASPPHSTIAAIKNDIVITNATAPANNGTFPLTGLDGDAAEYVNAAGVAGVDAAARWTIVKRHPIGGEVIDGFKAAFLSRGYRMGQARAAIVIILPYGSTTGVEASIREMLRQKKGAGVKAIIERRLNP